jgi:hypothetical protein
MTFDARLREKDTEDLTPEKRFDLLIDEFRGTRGITLPDKESKKKTFGSSGIKVHGKIFTMLTSDGMFVVKLSRLKVDEYVRAGEGKRFDPRKNGTEMKEWLVVDPKSNLDWSHIAKEAIEFVCSKPAA